MKSNNRHISKKNMPKDLRRVTDSDGSRVWITGGKKYASLREVKDALKIQE